jgi:hypothetical protein
LAVIQDAIANRDHYVLNPTAFVFTTQGGFVSYLERATKPLDIFFGSPAVTVPEPQSAMLFLLGLVGLVGMRKKTGFPPSRE